MMAKIVYSRHYNMGFYGLERLHPFDTRKYGRAWKRLRQHFGSAMREMRVRPRRPASRDELMLVHSRDYLTKLGNPDYVAGALEVPQVNRLPSWIIDRHVLRPMRWATRGTLLAATEALTHGFAVNLGGGYHHAKLDRGEGFCIYSDIAIAVAALRKANSIEVDSRIAYIDTDAHQGNGVCHSFMSDSHVFIFDIFNSRIYPMMDVEARKRIDCEIPLTDAVTDAEYMNELRGHLPGFLDSVGRSPIGLAIYNAGTDVLTGDPLGGLNISDTTIHERDMYVVSQLRKRGIPTIMLLSGGYTKQSYQVIADSITQLINADW